MAANKHRGRLTLRDPLGVQRAIPFHQVNAFEVSPALGAIMRATVLYLDYRCHSYLLYRGLYQMRRGGLRMAREFPGFNPYLYRVMRLPSRHRDEMVDAMIEA